MFIFFWLFQDAERDESGSIVSEGSLDIFSLRIGDCFNEQALVDLEPGKNTELAPSVEAVPCNMPHDNEVFAISEYLFSDLNFYPSSEELEKRIYDFCGEEMDKYLSVDENNIDKASEQYDRLNSEGIIFTYLYPLEEGWNSGDKLVSCLLTDIESRSVGSYRDFFKN